MLTVTTGPDGRRPKAPVKASATMRATPIAARAAMNAPKMRSKVVSAMVRLPRRRSRPLWFSFCQDAAKRESSISAGLSPVEPKTTTRNSRIFMRSGGRRAMQDDLEHEARADVGEQQQRRTRVDATRGLQAAPAEGAPAREQTREDEPAEDREHRLVVPAPVVAE